jgi:dolichol-phosphate mannosyltransferase
MAPELSVVIPSYNEQENIRELYKELKLHLDQLDESWELIFVDDGSKDKTWKLIKSLHIENQRVKGIQFSRNFGHQYALFSGLAVAKGNAVITMDADLQHPPSVIPELVDEWRKGSKIVNTVRQELDNLSGFKKLTSRLYYKVFSFLTGVHIQKGMADFRLLDRQVLKTILKFDEDGLFLRGIVQWLGFPSSSVTFKCRERFRGQTKYSLKKMIKFAVDGILSFSVIPLRLGILVGMLISLFSFYLIFHSIYAYYQGLTVPGWTTTVTVLSFMFGTLFILLGLIGEYIGKILIQVRARPRFITNDKVGIQSEIEDSATHETETSSLKDSVIS